MRQHLTKQFSKLLLAFAAATAASASAFAEQMEMPFMCSARGGEVRLMPSERQTYQIFGRHEQHVYSVCSPTDANHCRNWMIHRFDVDCGGTRVPWINVADAASRFARGRAWVEGGQMNLALAPNRSSGYDDDYSRRRPWRDRGPVELDTVTLPPGFAPTLGLPVQFVGGEGRGGIEDGPPPGAYADGSWNAPASHALPPDERRGWQEPPAGGWDASPRPAQRSEKVAVAPVAKEPAPQAAPAPKEKAPAPEKAATPEKAAAPEKPAAKSSPAAPTAPTSPAASSPAGTSAPTPPNSATAPQGPKLPEGMVTPTIINGSNAGAPAPTGTAEALPAAKPETTTAPTEPPASVSATASEKFASAKENTETTKTSVLDVSGLSPGQSSSALPVSPPVLWGGLAGASLLALSAFLLLRRKDSAQMHQRDLGSVNFEAPPKGGTALATIDPASPPAVVAPRETGVVVQAAAGGDVALPTALAEAFSILGTNADAPTEVIKKIVDGLRQSWHSDLARSDDERVYREKRMQQVNAAWDLILQSRRAAA